MKKKVRICRYARGKVKSRVVPQSFRGAPLLPAVIHREAPRLLGSRSAARPDSKNRAPVAVHTVQECTAGARLWKRS